jgi:hypothetical protein
VGIDGLEADDGVDDDVSSETDSLAFLAGLLGATILNTATPAGSAPAGTANVAEANPSDGSDGAGGFRWRTLHDPGLPPARRAPRNKSGDLLAAVDALTCTRADSTDGTGDTRRRVHVPPNGWRMACGTRPRAWNSRASPPRCAIRDGPTDFATRISLMVRGGESQASLQLTPLDLGPMDVNVTVRDGQASIHFGARIPKPRADRSLAATPA